MAIEFRALDKMPAEAILDVAPLEVQGKRTLRGFVGKLFRKRWSKLRWVTVSYVIRLF